MNKLKEAIKTPLGITILVTVVVVILLIVLTIIKDTFLGGETIDYSILFLTLVTFLIYLAVTGKISEIGGGGFGIKFNKVSEGEVFFKLRGVEYANHEMIKKVSLSGLRDNILPEIAEKQQSTLELHKTPSDPHYYTYEALKGYLKELTKFDFFKYVLFVDENDVFNGYMYARSLLAQFSDEEEEIKDIKGKEVIKDINKWNLNKIKGVKNNYIKNYQSNRETLRIMERAEITDIAVVDKNMKFKGFTNREIITSKIVNNLMNKAE